MAAIAVFTVIFRDGPDIRKRGVMIFDGAYGTVLMKRHGVQYPCLLNLDKPSAVRTLHREYIRAGADVISTNTFFPGEADRYIDVVIAGVDIALNASRGKALTALSVGPAGSSMPRDIYFELAGATAAYPLDFILLETFYDMEDASDAVRAFERYFPFTDIILSVFPAKGVESLHPMLPLLTGDRRVTPGINCVMPDKEAYEMVKYLAVRAGNDMYFSPNAGKPGAYIAPGAFASFMENMPNTPAFLGGCCGTTPAHIKALKSLSLRV